MGLVAVVLVSLLPGRAWATADPTGLCLDTPDRLETFSLFAPALGRSKRILVYLPPDYDCAPTRRYPVFYFNDGHDLFEGNPLASDLAPVLAAEIAAREGWYGSWRLNRQLDRAIADSRLPPLIAVGIASDDGMRSRDLAPVPWRASGEGRGTQYGDFIAHAVVPAVDSRFRTLVDRRCRGIGGASLGAVSALQIGLTHPDRFGSVLAFSPVLGDPALAEYLATRWAAADHAGAPAVLIDFDDDPIGTADLEWFASVVAPDTGGGQATLLQTLGGRHTIASWAKRVIPGLMRLLDGQCSD